MALGVRGFNPIWSLFSVTGRLFDDTYYMWVLQNEIPYIPADIFSDPDLSVPLTNPVQFLANGTLPVDVFFESNVVYRLEFRQHCDPFSLPSQSDPLIYEVDNYVPGEGGSTPVDTIAFTSDNQVTNPQFSLVNFVSPYSLVGVTNPAPIEIGPGWFLELSGTGNVTINQVALTNTTPISTNSPYALRLTLSGWTNGSVMLRQRFYQNGLLWSSTPDLQRYVSSTVTAEINGSIQQISANLYDSNGTLLTQVLDNSTVTQTFNEFTGYGLMPVVSAGSNPDVPPAAYIDYKLALPSNIDIFLTSFQLVLSDLPIEPSFQQDSVNRQIDYTFHYYKDKLAFKPIESLLVGWDFATNPNQIGGSSISNTPLYVWDQTVMQSRSAATAIGRQTNTGALTFTTSTANESVLMLQYLDGAQAIKTTLSNLAVNLQMYCQNNGGVTVNVALFYSSGGGTVPSLNPSGSPATIGSLGANGIFTLTQSGWTPIPQQLGFSASGAVTTTPNQDIKIIGFNGATNYNISSVTNFAIAVSFAVPTSGTTVAVQSISLTPGDIATRPAPQTIDEVLRECQYYYEITGPIIKNMYAGNTAFPKDAQPVSFSIEYRTQCRSSSPNITLISGFDGALNKVYCALVSISGVFDANSSNENASGTVIGGSIWTQDSLTNQSVNYLVNTNYAAFPSAASAIQQSYIKFYFAKESRIGFV